jgi:hypothetical protein
VSRPLNYPEIGRLDGASVFFRLSEDERVALERHDLTCSEIVHLVVNDAVLLEDIARRVRATGAKRRGLRSV